MKLQKFLIFNSEAVMLKIISHFQVKKFLPKRKDVKGACEDMFGIDKRLVEMVADKINT